MSVVRPERPRGAAADAVLYARSLHAYAARRLDPFSLRCWIIQRLMLDQGLEHETAELVYEEVLSPAERCGNPAAPARKTRRSVQRDT
jgi:hypothetical protein